MYLLCCFYIFGRKGGLLAMPRMSKKRKQEWALFLNDRNAVVNKITATLTVASPSRKSRKGLPAFLMPKTQKEVFFKCFDYTRNFMTS